MVALTETRHAGAAIASESNGTRSREKITIFSGQNLLANTVLGKVMDLLSAASATAFADNSGDGAMGTITAGAGARPGDYKLTIIEPAANAGVFQLEDPDGIVIGTGDVASAFSGGGLSFTLADGATDFAAGDGFTITVAEDEGSGKYKLYEPDNTDGSGKACAVLFDDVDASGGDKAASPSCAPPR